MHIFNSCDMNSHLWYVSIEPDGCQLPQECRQESTITYGDAPGGGGDGT